LAGSWEIQSASLDQHGKVGAIAVVETSKPLVHLQLLSHPETVVVLPLVALQLLLPSLIGGATSQSGIASIYSGSMTANGTQALATGMTAAHRSIPFGTSTTVAYLL
jgi:rare lipoprotein A (peptidoglycan hydrolase)